MKDFFSASASVYALNRPGYPQALFDYLRLACPRRECAWDCATGNGQIAGGLSAFFKEVKATDISEQQMAHAYQAPNISYSKEAAEQSSFAGHSFDLIIVAQAIHWFRFDEFYKEVRRTLRPDGLFVVAGYNMAVITPAVDKILLDFQNDVVGPYWDPERIYIDERYETIPFPFREIDTPSLAYEARWSLERLCGYVESWSATRHYIKARGTNPVPALMEALRPVWGNEPLPLAFPVLLRAGRL
ncbi:class I SAM-dependent methyltransferase [Taibaiella koreensis]|uniref:class I SAM-dependent methyltransferase n=1 Tax=Taibaiella koreensis TaxID=1268548 RepID=UPI000E59CA5A|nr:class I SAM-dependent methyltransferase [Taibaiella koreensis]